VVLALQISTMAERAHDLKFEVLRDENGCGWYVRISRPNAGNVQIYDFQSEAAAKVWIKVHMREWINDSDTT
jgi:hypothetical protein